MEPSCLFAEILVQCCANWKASTTATTKQEQFLHCQDLKWCAERGMCRFAFVCLDLDLKTAGLLCFVRKAFRSEELRNPQDPCVGLEQLGLMRLLRCACWEAENRSVRSLCFRSRKDLLHEHDFDAFRTTS